MSVGGSDKAELNRSCGLLCTGENMCKVSFTSILDRICKSECPLRFNTLYIMPKHKVVICTLAGLWLLK